MTWDEFDQGNTGNQGPFLMWSARGTQDGQVPSQAFYLREREGGKTVVTDKIRHGLMLDMSKLKTGWQESSGMQGVAPTWKWNQTVNHFAPSPGEDWKRGFQLPVAFDPESSAMWEQAGAGAWQALVNIIHQLKTQDLSPKLPVVKLTQVHTLHLGKGTTSWPELAIVGWKDRPKCLAERSEAAQADTGGPAGVGVTGENKLSPPPAQTGGGDLNDDIPF